MSITCSLLVPPGESPDEPAHYKYVNTCIEQFPIPQREYPSSPDVPSILKISYETHQPPLYYWMTSIVTLHFISPGNVPGTVNPDYPASPNRFITGGSLKSDFQVYSRLYHARFFSVFLFLLTMFAVYRTGSHLFPQNSPGAASTVLFFGCIPQVIFIFSTVNNDTLAIFLAAVFFERLTALIKNNQSGYNMAVQLGIITGFALLTKLNLFYLVLTTILVFFFRPGQASLRDSVKHTALFLVITAFICGWWYTGNALKYGDPTGMQYQMLLFTKPGDYLNISTAWFFMKMTVCSFFGIFGWMNIFIPLLIIRFYAVIYVLGLLIFFRYKDCRNFMSGIQGAYDRKTLFFSCVTGLCFLAAAFINFNLNLMQPQGRLLFSALPFLAPLYAASFLYLTTHKTRTLYFCILIMVFVLFSICSIYYGLVIPYR